MDGAGHAHTYAAATIAFALSTLPAAAVLALIVGAWWESLRRRSRRPAARNHIASRFTPASEASL
jgi:hypothetical protein